MKILFLHGFMGSGTESSTASLLREEGYEVLAPDLSLFPITAIKEIRQYIKDFNPDLIVANSLGGFYALTFSNIPKLVINPAFNAPTDIVKVVETNPLLMPEVGLGIIVEQLNQLYYFWSKYSKGENENKFETYALFGENDEFFHHYDDFAKFYDKNKAKLIPTSHHLSEDEVKAYVLPAVEQIRSEYGIK